MPRRGGAAHALTPGPAGSLGPVEEISRVRIVGQSLLLEAWAAIPEQGRT